MFGTNFSFITSLLLRTNWLPEFTLSTVQASSAIATAEERETALQQVEDGSLMETENGQVEAAGGPAEAVDDHLEVD